MNSSNCPAKSLRTAASPPTNVIAAIAEIRAEQAVRFGGLRGELEYDDESFDVDPDVEAMFYGDTESR
jgi:hypothetical protein